ncbi:MAG: hypothetical protein OFPII_28040 [Osedax symbiont Rs1]|nr:MAG: hypothetical protein OFPII_28040 [Osedax symbiont Rs1]
MLRKLGLIIAISGALVVGKVNALGMGDIRVKSALNEPLHAEIELFQVKNLSPLQIKSRMADLNDFALSGLATQRALTAVRFQTRVRANGTGRIILTSKLPITEPFMNFLVEVNWPSGRLIREYTLLLDPPSYRTPQNNNNFAIRENASSVAQRPVVSAKRQKAKPARPKVYKTPKNITLEKGQYYISSKDTLWDIAIASRPSQKVSPQRMMMLIQRNNPQAFPNGNINVMTANVVIDLPTQTEIDALSGKEAEQEVTRQTTLWQSGVLSTVVNQAPAKVEQQAKPPAVKSKQDADKLAPVKAEDETKQAGDKKSADASGKAPATEKGVGPAVAADKNTGKEQPDNLEKGMLNVVTAEESAAKRDLQAKADAMAIAASKDSEKIAELLTNNTEMGVKLALSQESIDKLERDNQELNKKLTTIIEQLADINRLIMLKDQQLAVMEDERDEAEKEQQKKAKIESDKSWLDRLLENPVGMATAGIGWLLAIIAGVFLLLRRKKKDQEEVMNDGKNEPSISLPESMMEPEEEEPQELEVLEKDSPSAVEDMIGDVDDLDLDLDMDMELDETLEGTTPVAGVAGDESDDDDDLAAELEAQLNTADEEDDDLDMLDGIDSLEFDLGEVEEAELDLDEDLAEEDDEEKRALAEFAAAMEAPDDENSAEDVTDSDDLESDELDSIETDVLDSLGLDDAEQEELETAEQADDELEISLDNIEDELEIEIPENDQVSVEEDDLDISEIPDQVTSLDELAAMEDLAEAEELANTPVEEDLEEVAPDNELAEDSFEIDLNEDGDDSNTEQAAEDEDEQQPALESAALEKDEPSEPPAAENVFEEVMAENIENDLADELEIEIPEENDTSESTVASAGSSSNSEVLEEQLDELLGSTDDEIALEAVAPEFDADNEEEIDLLSGEDGMRMKLDLARAYIEMGDADGAKDIIKEVMDAGEADHLSEAQELLDSIESKKK